MHNFKYAGINVPSTNRWNLCYESRIPAGWNSYYKFENQCNKSDTLGWEVRSMLFNTMVVQMLLMIMHNIEIYTTLHKQRFGRCLPLSKRTETQPDQGSTTMAFLCKILVSCSLTNPPYHNYCRLTLVSPLSLAHTRLKRPSRGLQHVQLFDQTRQGKHLIHAESITEPILGHICNRILIEDLPNR